MENSRLAALFGGKPPIGSGMAAEAAKIIQSRPYKLHVEEAKAMGENPMTPEEWMAAQKKRTGS